MKKLLQSAPPLIRPQDFKEVSMRIHSTVMYNGREHNVMVLDHGQDADYPFELAV